MQMFPDDLPLANIDADGYCCHFMRSSVRPSNHPWAWVCVLHTKRLEEMAYNLACWCIQLAYTQHTWMLMDIVVGLSVRPSVRLFVYGIFRWLCICWQIIIGRWLLPSLVDTGDVCCHYWQHILVVMAIGIGTRGTQYGGWVHCCKYLKYRIWLNWFRHKAVFNMTLRCDFGKFLFQYSEELFNLINLLRLDGYFCSKTSGA